MQKLLELVERWEDNWWAFPEADSPLLTHAPDRLPREPEKTGSDYSSSP
jgi:hypothetical protein